MSSINAAKLATGMLVITALVLGLLLILLFATGRPVEYTAASRIIVVVAVCLVVASLMLRPAAKVKLTVFLVSTWIALFALELFLSFTDGPIQPDLAALAAAAKRENTAFDTRSHFQVFMDLRDAGVEAYPTDAGGDLLRGSDGVDFLALGLKSNATAVGCSELGEFVIYQTDEHGFNNPLGSWGKHRIDVISIGDSYTHALCVNPDKTPTAMIGAVHGNTLNLGISGTGPLMQLAIMKEYVGALRPKVVLWFYIEVGDLSDLVTEEDDFPIAMKYLETDYRQDLVSRQEEIDRGLDQLTDHYIARGNRWEQNFGVVYNKLVMQELRRRILPLFRGEQYGGYLLYRNRWNEPCVSEEILTLFERVLQDGKKFVDSWGGDLYFVYLPMWVRYGDPSEACGYDEGDVYYHDQVLSLVKSVGLPIIDITEATDAHPDPLSLWPFRLKAHYNEDGYKLVAEKVLETIPVRE